MESGREMKRASEWKGGETSLAPMSSRLKWSTRRVSYVYIQQCTCVCRYRYVHRRILSSVKPTAGTWDRYFITVNSRLEGKARESLSYREPERCFYCFCWFHVSLILFPLFFVLPCNLSFPSALFFCLRTMLVVVKVLMVGLGLGCH